MALSENDLITLVAQYANYCSAEEVPSDLDYSFIQKVVRSEAQQMVDLGMPIANGSIYSIPEGSFSLLGRRMAYPVGLAVGLWTPDQVEAGIQMVEKRIRAAGSLRSTGATTSAEYF
jgi:hypothetical protein